MKTIYMKLLKMGINDTQIMMILLLSLIPALLADKLGKELYL